MAIDADLDDAQPLDWLRTRKRWKLHAAQVDRPLSAIVIEVMGKYLATQKAP